MNTKYDLNGKVKMFPLSRYDSNIWFWIESISRNPLVFSSSPPPPKKKQRKIGTNYNTDTAIQSTKFLLRQYWEVTLIHWNIYFLKWLTTKQIHYKLMLFQEIKKEKHKEMKTAMVFSVLFTLCQPHKSGRDWFTFYPFSKF